MKRMIKAVVKIMNMPLTGYEMILVVGLVILSWILVFAYLISSNKSPDSEVTYLLRIANLFSLPILLYGSTTLFLIWATRKC